MLCAHQARKVGLRMAVTLDSAAAFPTACDFLKTKAMVYCSLYFQKPDSS